MRKRTAQPKVRLAVVRDIGDAPACPFYAQDEAGHNFCFIKNAVSLVRAGGLIANEHFVTEEDWASDCGGSWDNCSVLPLLYDFDEGDVDPNARDDMEDYSPFDEADDGEEEDTPEVGFGRFTPPAVAEAEAQRREESEQEQFSGERPAVKSMAKFSIHQVPDPYRVKCDSILVPVNNLLEAMDPLLMRHVGPHLEAARAQHREAVHMGWVYPFKPPAGTVSAKKSILRGVVAGVQAVNVVDIESCVSRALNHAESSGVEVLAMVPMDYGGFDLELTAQAQLSTIYEFMVSRETESLKHIVVLIIDDATMEVYEEYRRRIFEDL